MTTPSSGQTSAVEAILEKWREYRNARISWLKGEKREEAAHNRVHASRLAQRKEREQTAWKELTSMIDKCDLETAKAALGCLSRYRVQTLSDIDKIHAQYAASNVEGLRDAVDATGEIIQHLVDHIVKIEPVSLA